MTKIPPDDILEGLYKLRTRESEKVKTVLELYDLEIHQKKLGPDYDRLKTKVKRSIEQDIRNKNFGSRNGNYEKNAVVKNQGTKQRVQRILGDCWQLETNGQCIKGDNCSFRHDVNKCGRGEGVQGVLTLLGRGKAQVCHVLRVVELLKEQLEVEEEDGDKQEEEEEVESGETSQRGAPMNMTVDDYECAQNLSHEVCGVITNCGRCPVCGDSQCMYATRPLKCRCIVSTSSLVSCLVSNLLLYASFQFSL